MWWSFMEFASQSNAAAQDFEKTCEGNACSEYISSQTVSKHAL